MIFRKKAFLMVKGLLLTVFLIASSIYFAANIRIVRAQSDFIDNFDDGVADNWTVQLGSWSVINGEYCVSVGVVENGISTVNGLDLTDCTIETKMRFTDSVGYRAGIVFRYLNSSHYYSFEIGNEYGEIDLIKYSSLDPNYGEKREVIAPNVGNSSIIINANVYYTLRLEVHGANFDAYLDGQPVLSWTDNSYNSGLVGLRARRADVSFDNFQIENANVSPSPTPSPLPSPSTQPLSGLVGYWKFDEGSGTTSIDSSGFDNTATLVNSPQWVDGISGKALSFNGINSYVAMQDSPSLRVKSLTFAAWIFMTERPFQHGSRHSAIFNKIYFQIGTGDRGYNFEFVDPTPTNDNLVLAIGDGINDFWLIQYNTINDLTLNQWHHVAAAWDGTVASIYIDGQLKSSANTPAYTIAHDSTALALGTETTSGAKDVWFKGIIDEARIYNKALSSQEISDLHNSLTTLAKPTITMSCKSTTSYSDFKVEIQGDLKLNGTSIANAPILIAYSVNNGNSWADSAMVYTVADGTYLSTWIPSVTGNYLVKATFEGNENYLRTNTVRSLAVFPFAEVVVFSASSNSTAYNLTFNSTSREVSFNVTGDAGTTGYSDVFIAKTLIQNVDRLQVYLDGDKLECSVSSLDDSWIVHFLYNHSTHSIVVDLGARPGIENILGNWIFYAPAVVAAIVTIIVIAVLAVRRRKASRK